MAKSYKKVVMPSGKQRNADEVYIRNQITAALREYDFDLLRLQKRDKIIRLIAQRDFNGRELTLQLAIVPDLRIPQFSAILREQNKHSNTVAIDQTWIIYKYIHRDVIKEKFGFEPEVRAIPIDELNAEFVVLSPPKPRKKKPGKKTGRAAPRTAVGKAITVNKEAIMVAIAAVLAQLDDRIETLRNERPNSDDGIKARDTEISDFERMRQEVDHIRNMVVEYTKGEVSEQKATKPIITFTQGVGDWWTKDHIKICARASTFGLFASALTVCAIAGAGGMLSATIAGAMYGGKPVVAAIKALGKGIGKGIGKLTKQGE